MKIGGGFNIFEPGRSVDGKRADFGRFLSRAAICEDRCVIEAVVRCMILFAGCLNCFTFTGLSGAGSGDFSVPF